MKRKTTLLKILESRAEDAPDKIAFRFYNQPPCTFGRMWQNIECCSCYLMDKGIKKGDRILVVIPNSEEFFYAFYGIQRVGGIAVPVFPGSGPERVLKLTELCEASFIIISRLFPPVKYKQFKDVISRNEQYCKKFLEVEDCVSSDTAPKSYRFPEIAPHETAFIQFTSGSTGDPKGVMLSHGGIMVNLDQMIAGMKITTRDVFISWLPVYHDMGLILMTMVPFYLGLQLYLLPTGLRYLKKWLEGICENHATFTAAPDFAYRYCLRIIKDKDRHNYDLSHLRVALNAAEPVRADTIARFETAFGLKNVLLPAYGLAEATVGVCCHSPGREIKVDNRSCVSVGMPFSGIEMKVVNEDNEIKTGEIGEILVKSPACTTGYYGNREATEGLFTQDGFLHTGDLGYVDGDGHYFIMGRRKNIIIQGGFNVSSREVEELADGLEFVRRSAAVGIDRGGNEGEQVYLFLEIRGGKTKPSQEDQWKEMVVTTVKSFELFFGFRPGRVYLIKTRGIPMTHNGKTRYSELKKRYLEGTLKNESFILYPGY